MGLGMRVSNSHGLGIIIQKIKLTIKERVMKIVLQVKKCPRGAYITKITKKRWHIKNE